MTLRHTKPTINLFAASSPTTAAAAAIVTTVTTASASLTLSVDADEVEELTVPEADVGKSSPNGAQRGRKTGAQNWTTQHIDLLLDQVEAMLPRGNREWETVINRFNLLAQQGFSVERVRNKFFSLMGTKKPTRENTRPDQITRTLKIADMIDAKSFGGTAGGSNNYCSEDEMDAVDLSQQTEYSALLTKRSTSLSSLPSLSSSASDLHTPSLCSSSSSSPPSKPNPSTSLPPFTSGRNGSMKRPKHSSYPVPDVLGAAHVLGQQLTEAITKMTDTKAQVQREALELQRQEMQLRRDVLEWKNQQAALRQQPG